MNLEIAFLNENFQKIFQLEQGNFFHFAHWCQKFLINGIVVQVTREHVDEDLN